MRGILVANFVQLIGLASAETKLGLLEALMTGLAFGLMFTTLAL